MAAAKKLKYFKIEADKFEEISKIAEQSYLYCIQSILHYIPLNNMLDWSELSISILIRLFCASESLKDLLFDIKNNPTEDVKKYIEANKEKDIIMDLDDLDNLKYLYSAIEVIKVELYEKHNIAMYSN